MFGRAKTKKGLEKKLTLTTFHQVHVCHVDTIPQLNNVLTFCIFTVTFVFSPHLLHLCVVSITSLSPTLNTFFFFFTLFFIFMSNYSHINEKSYCFAVSQASSGKKLWWEYIAAKQFCCFGFKIYIYIFYLINTHTRIKRRRFTKFRKQTLLLLWFFFFFNLFALSEKNLYISDSDQKDLRPHGLNLTQLLPSHSLLLNPMPFFFTILSFDCSFNLL